MNQIMAQKINSPHILLAKEVNNIKNYHQMVEYFVFIGSDAFEYEDEEGLSAGQKWIHISDIFNLMGFSSKTFSPTKCRSSFYKWSAFYAQNYNKLNCKLKPKVQKTFDLLKIVHILDFNKFWVFDNSTHTLLREISAKPEIEEYVNQKQKNLEINCEIQREVKTKWETLNQNSERVSTFQDMNLDDNLLKGILDLGYSKPSAIQQRAIIACINGRDVIAQAQSGTGKTAAFAIAILQKIDLSVIVCQALILAPTRELAQQIHKEISNLGKYMTVRSHLSIGGTDFSDELKRLYRKKPHIVVGTMGRVSELFKRRAFTKESVKILVIDEFDKMLETNRRNDSNETKTFDQQIREMYKSLKPPIQVIFSSATLPRELIQMSQLFMTNPLNILVNEEELTLEGLQQYYVNSGEEHLIQRKFKVFLELYENITKDKRYKSSTSQMFVYCNKITSVDLLVRMLANNNIRVPHMHGHTDQDDRQKTLKDFRDGISRVLITTDLLGRGIDVKEVEFVINYDLPQKRETYIHRVGRSGRFGRTGIAITIVTEPEKKAIHKIEKFYNTEVKALPQNLSTIF